MKRSNSDTEGGRVKKFKSRRKGKKLQRSLSENAKMERERERMKRNNERRRAMGSLDTPYNTPYLLVSEHSDQQFPNPERFYSQTESQLEDFVDAEFRKDYDQQLYERLEKMSREMLMSEYFSQERRIEQLEQKISDNLRREEEEQRKSESLSRNQESEKFDMINVFQLIQRLAYEFNILKMENEKLLGQNFALNSKLYSITA